MRGVLIYRLRVCWRLLWFGVILTMLVLCSLVVFHLLPEKDCRVIKTSLFRFILDISTRSHIGYREFSSSNMLQHVI